LVDRIRDAWDSVRPDLVFTFDCESPARPYVHPDHQAVGRAVLHILDGAGRQATAYLFSSALPDAAVDITEVLGQKMAGIRAHRTQFGGTGGGGVAEQNRGSGTAMGYGYTELFRVRGPQPQ
ncbi:MAG: PIG-L deacetylase family protein, partial [Bacillota bacterium]